MSSYVGAATLTWTGLAGDGNINSPGNWSPAQAPTAGDLLVFSGGTSLLPQLSSGLTVGSLSFASGAGAFTLGGSGTYTVGASGISNNSSNTQTINNPITLGAAQTWNASTGNLAFGGNINTASFLLTIGGAANTSISAVISGSGGLTKTGTGTLTFSGTNNNNYTGLTSVNDGTVQLNMTATKNASNGDWTVGDGAGAPNSAVLRWLASNQIPNKALTVNADGLADLNNFSDTIGTLTLTGGKVVTGTGTLIIGGDLTTNASANSAIITGTLGLSADRIFTVADGTAADDLLVAANIVGNHKITKAGTGTLVLSGTNLISDLTISAGVLRAESSGALGVSTPVVASGAALQVKGGISLTNDVTVNGGGIANDGALRNISGNNTLSGKLILASNTIIGSDAGTLTLSGLISGNFTLTKVGAGTLSYNGTANNTNNGLTTVADGALLLNMTAGKNASNGDWAVGDSAGAANSATLRWLASNQILNKTLSVFADGLADLNGFSDTIGAVNMTGGSIATGAGTLTLGGNVTGNGAATSATISGNLALGGDRTFAIADGAAAVDMNISAVVSGGNNLTKTGPGTLVFSGANTYTGSTTVSAGVLNVQNATALGTTGSGTTVSSGATLQLEGGITIGAEALSIVGSGASGQTGALVNTGGVNNYGGLITLTGGTTVGSDSGTLNLTNTGTITGSGSGLTLAGAANGSISSIIGTGTGSLTKNGSGTWSLLGANTLTGNVTISAGTLTLAATSGSALGATNAITVNSGGTLLLGANNQINNAASITLAGGTFAKGNFNEGGAAAPGVGALTLAATGSILDFGTGTVGVLEFASFTANGLLLAINNWTGLANTVGSGSTDRLIFGSDQSANLGGFSFSGYSGATQFALGGGYFEIVPTSPVPEPATYFGGLLTLLALAYTQRHRLKRQKLTLSLRKTDTAP